MKTDISKERARFERAFALKFRKRKASRVTIASYSERARIGSAILLETKNRQHPDYPFDSQPGSKPYEQPTKSQVCSRLGAAGRCTVRLTCR